MKLFIGGSKQIGKLGDGVLRKIDGYIERGYDILIGDCHGVDLAVQRYLKSRGVHNVTVYCSGTSPRYNVGKWKVIALNNTELSGYEFYRLKDVRMIDDADCGFMIWNGKSRGTAQNLLELKSRGKPVEVIYSGDEIMDDITRQYVTNGLPFGSAYILPDGQMLDLSVLGGGHADFFALTGYTAEALKERGWLRLNTKLKYIELPHKITIRQRAILDRVYDVFGKDFQIK